MIYSLLTVSLYHLFWNGVFWLENVTYPTIVGIKRLVFSARWAQGPVMSRDCDKTPLILVVKCHPKWNKAIHKHPDIDMIFGPFLRPGLCITPLVLTAFTAFFRHLEATHVTCWDRQGFGRCFLPLSESNSKVWKSQKTNEGAKVERSFKDGENPWISMIHTWRIILVCK